MVPAAHARTAPNSTPYSQSARNMVAADDAKEHLTQHRASKHSLWLLLVCMRRQGACSREAWRFQMRRMQRLYPLHVFSYMQTGAPSDVDPGRTNKEALSFQALDCCCHCFPSIRSLGIASSEPALCPCRPIVAGTFVTHRMSRVGSPQGHTLIFVLRTIH